MGRTIAIVQARMGSTRLPGKILLTLAAQTVLGHVLTRCAAVPGIDGVCCATTDLAEDDAVAEEASRHGASVHRGSAEDVLARYAGAARAAPGMTRSGYAMAAGAMVRNSNTCDRDKIVSGILPTRVVAMMKTTCGGGSSTDLSSALNELDES